MGRVLLVCLVLLSDRLAAADPAPIPVTVTAYTWSGLRTASGKWPAVGMLAVSRDLERDYHLTFGQRLHLGRLGTFRLECRMHRRWTRRVDIYLSTYVQAIRFGRRSAVLLVQRPAPQG